ncbi:MAG: hypothetical protein SW019_05770, partial [Actinomycetota bacterium]|nr:hypothetical protein [Actinomycetota bacterium]
MGTTSDNSLENGWKPHPRHASTRAARCWLRLGLGSAAVGAALLGPSVWGAPAALADTDSGAGSSASSAPAPSDDGGSSDESTDSPGVADDTGAEGDTEAQADVETEADPEAEDGADLDAELDADLDVDAETEADADLEAEDGADLDADTLDISSDSAEAAAPVQAEESGDVEQLAPQGGEDSVLEADTDSDTEQTVATKVRGAPAHDSVDADLPDPVIATVSAAHSASPQSSASVVPGSWQQLTGSVIEGFTALNLALINAL